MPRTTTYRSAYAHGAVTAADVLAFHRMTFGSTRMEDGEGGAGGNAGNGGEGGNASGTGGTGGQAEAGGAGSGQANESASGFPANTPWRDMKPEAQVAYWQHQARKHEGTAKDRADYEAIKAERDQLKSATQTETEKAIEAAKKEAGDAARAEERAKAADRLVAAEFRAELKGKRKPEDIRTLLEPLDLSKFLTADGEVDTDKVSTYAAGIASTGDGSTWPDTGAGRRGGGKSAPGQAGLDEAARRFGKPDAIKK